MRLISVETVEPPAGLPVTVVEFIDHARLNGITVDRQPDLIERELAAATRRAERFLRRSILTQKLKALYGPQARYGEPDCLLLVLPRGKVTAVDSVTSGGAIVDPATYTLQWNTIKLDSPLYAAAEVVYTSGYGTADDVPDSVKEGILEYATVLYCDRLGERPAKYATGAMQGIPAGIRDLWRSEQIELSG